MNYLLTEELHLLAGSEIHVYGDICILGIILHQH